MARNFSILTATLVFFPLLSAAMSTVSSSFQHGLATNGSLWRTVTPILLLAGLRAAPAACDITTRYSSLLPIQE
jgi:ABC-type Na+ efflux pump permease subunit